MSNQQSVNNPNSSSNNVSLRSSAPPFFAPSSVTPSSSPDATTGSGRLAPAFNPQAPSFQPQQVQSQFRPQPQQHSPFYPGMMQSPQPAGQYYSPASPMPYPGVAVMQPRPFVPAFPQYVQTPPFVPGVYQSQPLPHSHQQLYQPSHAAQFSPSHLSPFPTAYHPSHSQPQSQSQPQQSKMVADVKAAAAQVAMQMQMQSQSSSAKPSSSNSKPEKKEHQKHKHGQKDEQHGQKVQNQPQQQQNQPSLTSHTTQQQPKQKQLHQHQQKQQGKQSHHQQPHASQAQESSRQDASQHTKQQFNQMKKEQSKQQKEKHKPQPIQAVQPAQSLPQTVLPPPARSSSSIDPPVAVPAVAPPTPPVVSEWLIVGVIGSMCPSFSSPSYQGGGVKEFIRLLRGQSATTKNDMHMHSNAQDDKNHNPLLHLTAVLDGVQREEWRELAASGDSDAKNSQSIPREIQFGIHNNQINPNKHANDVIDDEEEKEEKKNDELPISSIQSSSHPLRVEIDSSNRIVFVYFDGEDNFHSPFNDAKPDPSSRHEILSLLVLLCTCDHVLLLHPQTQLQTEWIQKLRMAHALKSSLIHSIPSLLSKQLSQPSSSSLDVEISAIYSQLFSGSDNSLSCFPLAHTPCLTIVMGRDSILGLDQEHGDISEDAKILQQYTAKQFEILCKKFQLISSTSPLAAAPVYCSSSPDSTNDSSISSTIPPLFYLPHDPSHSIILCNYECLSDSMDGGLSVFTGGIESGSEEFDKVHELTITSLRRDTGHALTSSRKQLDLLLTHAPGRLSQAEAREKFRLSKMLCAIRFVTSWILVNPTETFVYHFEQLISYSTMDGITYQYSALKAEKAISIAKKHYLSLIQASSSSSSSTSKTSKHPTASSSVSSSSPLSSSPKQFFPRSVHLQKVQSCVVLYYRYCSGTLSENRVEQKEQDSNAESVRTQVLGPAVEENEQKLRKDLDEIWTSSHRGCEAVSILHRACILPYNHDSMDSSAEIPHLADGSFYTTEHQALPHSHRTSCLCGGSIVKVSVDPFTLQQTKYCLTAPCCINRTSIPLLMEPTLSSSHSQSPLYFGWELHRLGDSNSYNHEHGLSSLFAGFESSAGRTSFLQRASLPTPPGSIYQSKRGDGMIGIYVGCEYQCTAGHRWIAPIDEEAMNALMHPSTSRSESDPSPPSPSASPPLPSSAGFPRRAMNLVVGCIICRYLRYQAANQQIAPNSAFSSSSKSQTQQQQRPSHDRYAQLRRVYIVTPSHGTVKLTPQIQVPDSCILNCFNNFSPIVDAAVSSAAASASNVSGSSTPIQLPQSSLIMLLLPWILWSEQKGVAKCLTSSEMKSIRYEFLSSIT